MFDVQQTIKDLQATIEHLRNSGWIQGRNFDRSGGCCAWGAVLMATADRKMSAKESMDRAANVGRVFYRHLGIQITSYNDADGRTKEQVIRTLETVLNALKADPSVLTARKSNADD